MTRPVIVQKFGGSSVATPEHIARVADQVVRRRSEGCDLVVVVSAMGRATDELLQMAQTISPEPDRRELDMLLTVGERISMALLALAIRHRGCDAVSLTGSQSGILTTASHTNARVMEVRPFRVQDELEKGHIVIVAGYQGVSYQREITTLGRGGSDTTAVALAAALDAEACEIFSDVDGVWSADPRVVEAAQRVDALDYGSMHAMARSGARVLHAGAVEFAREHDIALYARKTGAESPGTVVRKDVSPPPATVAVTHRDAVLRLDAPAASGWETVKALRASGARLDGGVEVQGHLHALFDRTDFVGLAGNAEGSIDAENWGTVTAVGAALSAKDSALRALQEAGASPESTWVDVGCVHFVVPRALVADAARALHGALGLDDA